MSALEALVQAIQGQVQAQQLALNEVAQQQTSSSTENAHYHPAWASARREDQLRADEDEEDRRQRPEDLCRPRTHEPTTDANRLRIDSIMLV